MAIRNFKVRAKVGEDGQNPYKRHTSKRRLFQWAIEQEEGFTKAEFVEAAKELLETGETESKMPPDVYANAWWNEFYNKYSVFVDLED